MYPNWNWQGETVLGWHWASWFYTTATMRLPLEYWCDRYEPIEDEL